MMATRFGELQEQEFEFEVIRVNKWGEIVERKIFRVQQFTEDLEVEPFDRLRANGVKEIEPFDKLRANGVKLEMVSIPGGTFLMGSPKGEGYDDERPQYKVTVEPFFMGKYPVTQEQWETVMRKSPYRFKGARRPVENVSWDDAEEFCKRLSEKTGRAYSLPSEAQWEYACRAGTTTSFYFGETITTKLANYNGEFTYLSESKGIYRHETTEVGSFPPNTFGLYDMHGTIWEWCADPWHNNYQGAPADGRVWESGGDHSLRLVRGGSWHDNPEICRCAVRLKFNPAAGEDLVGFRVVCMKRET